MSFPSNDPIDASSPFPPRRIPKLKVRNRIEGLSPPPHLQGLSLDARPSLQDDEITPVINNASNARPNLPSRDSQTSNTSNTSRDSDDTTRPTASVTSALSPPSQSFDLSRGSPSFSIPSPTKKSGVFGFLSLKEPSTCAWEQFVEESKREAALKGSQQKSLAQLSQKKLPTSVPKVNSKWNGMPNHVQEKGQYWKSSLDMSRSNFSGASRRSDDSIKGSSRPSTGGSSRSSRTAKREHTAKAPSSSSSGDSVRGKKTTATRSSLGNSDRARPTMSTETFDQPTKASPATSPAGMPARSLFFPSDPAPPAYKSNVNVTLDSPKTTPVTPTSPSTISTVSRSYIQVLPKTSIAATNASPPLTKVTNTEHEALEEDATDDDDVTPTQEEANGLRLDGHARESSDASISPASPLTPDLGAPVGPHSYYNRFKTRSQPKSTESLPQWPLPTKPEVRMAHAEHEVKALARVVSESAEKRGPPSSSIGIPPQQDFSKLQFDFTSANSSGASSPASPIPPSTVVDPLLARKNKGPATVSAPQSPPPRNTPSPSSVPLIPPALMPGRVKTKPFDLDTIAESDAGSVRAPSLYLSPHMSLVDVRNEQPHNDTRKSLAESRASSEMSAQWHMSPKERLGFGTLIKHSSKKVPWPVAGSEDKHVEYFPGADGTWTADGEQSRRKSSLIGRLMR